MTSQPITTHWLTALERIIAPKKQLVRATSSKPVRAALDRAARATPHGEPIRLRNDPEFQA